MTNTERILILDTETTNSIDDPIVYDIGWEIFDLDGNLWDRQSFVNADVFLDKDLMSSAYFADKIPMYWNDIKKGTRELKTWKNICLALYRAIKDNDVKIVTAHNARFDYRSIHLTQRFLTSSKWRWVFPFGIEWWDTLRMAKAELKNDKHYIDYCVSHEYITANNSPRYTAEVIYRYITKNDNFEESHTGLEDVQIERKIFEYLMKRNPSIDGKLWGYAE